MSTRARPSAFSRSQFVPTACKSHASGLVVAHIRVGIGEVVSYLGLADAAADDEEAICQDPWLKQGWSRHSDF